MSKVFLEVLSDIIDQTVHVPVETFVALFTYSYVDRPKEIEINFVHQTQTKTDDAEGVIINVSNLNYKFLSKLEYEKTIASLCHLPVLVTAADVIIAGLCGVSRGIIKQQPNEEFSDLLGFKGSCLLAPSETSTWTKFCELDFINCTKQILKLNGSIVLDGLELPAELGQFEKHMSQPIRMHNIYKLARTKANDTVKEMELVANGFESISLSTQPESSEIRNREKTPRINKTRKPKNQKTLIHIDSSTPMDELNLDHIFVEGQHITLADLMIFSCFSLISLHLDLSIDSLPLTNKWMDTLRTENSSKIHFCLLSFKCSLQNHRETKIKCPDIIIPLKFSLYKSEAKRYKPKSRVFTRQQDISESLAKVKRLGVTIRSDGNDSPESNQILDWSVIPIEAMPEGGELPVKRLDRKKHQLQSLAKEIIEMAKPNDRIVDFCSGAGHLGIILAYKLPECTVILLENKEESLMRAKQRVKLLRLQNVRFVQSNLDYFCGQFDIGTSLHACGVATDIVLWHCLQQRANFVCCPCCYGGIQPVPHIQYPRSECFRNGDISDRDYMHIAHCADQAHDIESGPCNEEKSVQGQYCMDIVDTDRKLMAEECGYSVCLTRLVPQNCTPKNRLLIGSFDGCHSMKQCD